MMPNPETANSYKGKVTIPFIKVISVFLEEPNQQFTGSEIFKTTKLQSGTVYPMLARLKELGWLKAEWETVAPESDNRPRRLYKITGSGFNAATKFLDENVTPSFSKNFNSPVAA